MRRASLRRRLLLSFGLVFLLGLAAVVLYLLDARDQIRRSVIYIQAQELGKGLSAQSSPAELPDYYAGSPMAYTLYDATGELLWYSGFLDRPLKLKHYEARNWLHFSHPSWRKASGRLISIPVVLTDGATLMVSKEDRMERELLDTLFHAQFIRSLFVLLPFGVLGMVLAWFLLQWALRPVQRAARLASSIGPQSPELRIPLETLPVEIRPLAHAANLGLERFANAYEKEQQVLADAAHELRTPLTVLDLRLQRYRVEGKADWQAIDGELKQLSRLVGQLLLLARQEQDIERQQHATSSTRLTRVVRETVLGLLPLFDAANRSIHVHLQEHVEVKGQESLLRDAIRNCIENALLHGKADVMVRLYTVGGQAVLDIQDQGAGVPIEKWEAMFERFQKAQSDSEGSGLGLSIVRRILRNAGGDACFVSTQPCTIRLYFQQ
ncbi:sensor histidine kinase [Paenalcaligenes sp. Me131]|uniref:sensor histidine kinase n=1 Tax=Paenalcaligenes sp. Me131 TaxID=3392636 RepID=UPI003D2C88BC